MVTYVGFRAWSSKGKREKESDSSGAFGNFMGDLVNRNDVISNKRAKEVRVVELIKEEAHFGLGIELRLQC